MFDWRQPNARGLDAELLGVLRQVPKLFPMAEDMAGTRDETSRPACCSLAGASASSCS
jgi:hypothetical protein